MITRYTARCALSATASNYNVMEITPPAGGAVAILSLGEFINSAGAIYIYQRTTTGITSGAATVTPEIFGPGAASVSLVRTGKTTNGVPTQAFAVSVYGIQFNEPLVVASGKILVLSCSALNQQVEMVALWREQLKGSDFAHI